MANDINKFQWPNGTLLRTLGMDLPIVQAPMAGACDSAMVIAATRSGGLGSQPCAMLNAEQADHEFEMISSATNGVFNVNFFCHVAQSPDQDRTAQWKHLLAKYYEELQLDIDAVAPAAARAPFNDAMCSVVENHKPRMVSFHFGLPEAPLLKRVKQTGAFVVSSATTVDEAIWLERHGCDAVIAQGLEAGGHRGLFLDTDLSTQMGTLSLVPQVVDAVNIPVIAAGGISDGRTMAASLALGASAVQVGTLYLLSQESTISELHRESLQQPDNDKTALTNVFSGKPARGIVNRVMRDLGPISESAPVFPTAGHALAPLKKAAEANKKADFSSLWSGQSAIAASTFAARFDSIPDTAELTRELARDAISVMTGLISSTGADRTTD